MTPIHSIFLKTVSRFMIFKYKRLHYVDYKQFHQRMIKLLNNVCDAMSSNGFSEEEVQAGLYALVSFMDESINATDWVGREEWQNTPLQMHYFQENCAGEGFYERLDHIMNTESKHQKSLLRLYLLCLSMGFSGKYHKNPQEKNPIKQSIWLKLGTQEKQPVPPTQSGRSYKKIAKSLIIFWLCVYGLFRLFGWVELNQANDVVQAQKETLHTQLQQHQGGKSYV